MTHAFSRRSSSSGRGPSSMPCTTRGRTGTVGTETRTTATRTTCGTMAGSGKFMPPHVHLHVGGDARDRGVPPLAGFFSKDEIIWYAGAYGYPILWGVALATALLTAVYMTRLMVMTFHGENRTFGRGGASEAGRKLHEVPLVMWAPLGVLAVLSVVGGWAKYPGGAAPAAGRRVAAPLARARVRAGDRGQGGARFRCRAPRAGGRRRGPVGGDFGRGRDRRRHRDGPRPVAEAGAHGGGGGGADRLRPRAPRQVVRR